MFGDDFEFLVQARKEIEQDLATLRLIIHPIKSQLFETRHGANFVGFRVLPDRVRVRNDNLRRARKRLKQLQADYGRGELSVQDLIQRLQSWSAHLNHGDTYQLQEDIFSQYTFTRLS